jgi:hypothetical protein
MKRETEEIFNECKLFWQSPFGQKAIRKAKTYETGTATKITVQKRKTMEEEKDEQV